MSGNALAPARRPIDRRVQRTRERLGHALWDLLAERPFESIRVGDLLARADVGRATFYAHYRDKDDLFLDRIEEFLESTATLLERRGDTSDRVAPVRELLTHVGATPSHHAILVASGRLPDFLELGRGILARGIERRLARHPRSRGLDPVRRAALAQAFSGALFAQLMWWIERRQPLTPERMDDLFHRTVWGGLADFDGAPYRSTVSLRVAARRPSSSSVTK